MAIAREETFEPVMSVLRFPDLDEVFEYDGFTYVFDQTLLKQEKSIIVDYIKSPQGDGYRISVQDESFQHNLISLLET